MKLLLILVCSFILVFFAIPPRQQASRDNFRLFLFRPAKRNDLVRHLPCPPSRFAFRFEDGQTFKLCMTMQMFLIKLNHTSPSPEFGARVKPLSGGKGFNFYCRLRRSWQAPRTTRAKTISHRLAPPQLERKTLKHPNNFSVSFNKLFCWTWKAQEINLKKKRGEKTQQLLIDFFSRLKRGVWREKRMRGRRPKASEGREMANGNGLGQIKFNEKPLLQREMGEN